MCPLPKHSLAQQTSTTSTPVRAELGSSRASTPAALKDMHRRRSLLKGDAAAHPDAAAATAAVGLLPGRLRAAVLAPKQHLPEQITTVKACTGSRPSCSVTLPFADAYSGPQAPVVSGRHTAQETDRRNGSRTWGEPSRRAPPQVLGRPFTTTRASPSMAHSHSLSATAASACHAKKAARSCLLGIANDVFISCNSHNQRA